ncbi:MAG TPA: carbon monoxide dehydrogenase subunit G [Candidatus Limnocylindrales bacterium]|nr:carbon monoxide dehydrogenase subunit G [Candidatus Limnocylindrales bacterium]
MKVTGEYEFRASREQVWKALLDPDALAATLPGARRLEPTGSDRYAISIDVGVGSVKGTYDGTFALTDKVEREECTVRATASGRPGSVTTEARMRLEGDARARMKYEADATVTGPLAGVGQRLMGAAARRTTEQFLSALDDYIEAPAAVAAAAAPEPGAAVVPVAPRGGTDAKVIVASALGGFALALVGVAVGRWTARR